MRAIHPRAVSPQQTRGALQPVSRSPGSVDQQQVHNPLPTPPSQEDPRRLPERQKLPLPPLGVRPCHSTQPASKSGATSHGRRYGQNSPRPRLTFDSTLGYPGEGPIVIATYNLNGTKGGRLAAVLSQARKAKVDILMLQELHAYEDGSHLRAHRTATLLGWSWFAAPGETEDPASGVAVAVALLAKK